MSRVTCTLSDLADFAQPAVQKLGYCDVTIDGVEWRVIPDAPTPTLPTPTLQEQQT